MSTARKELSRIEKGGKETIVNEIKHFEFDTNIRFDLETLFDDWEYGIDNGICYDRDGDEIIMIEVNDCLEEVNNRLSEDEDTFEEECKRIKPYLEQFKDFTIWV